MNKSGFLRRVVILLLFVYFYSRFVLNNSQFIQDEQSREFLHVLLYAAVAWGIVTMLARRLKGRSDDDQENDDE